MEENVNEPGVRVSVDGALGVITLDRPQALNALTHDMVLAITQALAAWEQDPTVERVLLEGAGDRAFCAGGDVVAIRADVLAGGTAALDFWRDEYALNARIARYPKPVVALMDGLVLGGGVGLACHARHRIVTETSRVGMPETTIGFMPDVGGTWLLSHTPGELGTLLALTAEPVGAADALHLGLADAFVPRDRLRALRAALASAGVADALAPVLADAGPSPLAADRAGIDACFAFDDVRDILHALRDSGRHDLADTIESKSPTSLVLTLASLRRARDLPSLEAALVQEYRVAVRSTGLHDLVEGVRAQLVDKDREPRWQPATLDAVDGSDLELFFDPLPHDLQLPLDEGER